MTQCLLIKTKNKKRFLTHERNLISLIEYSKTFKSEIYLVEAESSQNILDLKSLTKALCDPQYSADPQYEIIEKVLPKSKDRKMILDEAKDIREFITERLVSGKPLSLKELKERYKQCKFTDACLCNHFSDCRKILSRKGYVFEKIGAGTYCSKSN